MHLQGRTRDYIIPNEIRITISATTIDIVKALQDPTKPYPAKTWARYSVDYQAVTPNGDPSYDEDAETGVRVDVSDKEIRVTWKSYLGREMCYKVASRFEIRKKEEKVVHGRVLSGDNRKSLSSVIPTCGVYGDSLTSLLEKNPLAHILTAEGAVPADTNPGAGDGTYLSGDPLAKNGVALAVYHPFLFVRRWADNHLESYSGFLSVDEGRNIVVFSYWNGDRPEKIAWSLTKMGWIRPTYEYEKVLSRSLEVKMTHSLATRELFDVECSKSLTRRVFGPEVDHNHGHFDHVLRKIERCFASLKRTD